MVRALGDDYIKNHVIPATQIGCVIRPDEIADAICFLIRNSAVNGQRSALGKRRLAPEADLAYGRRDGGLFCKNLF